MEKRSTKLLIIPITLVIFLIGYFSGYSDKKSYGYEFKLELLDALINYEVSTEILIDSISIQNKSFMDTVMESKEYFQYSITKEKVDSLYNTQL